MHTAWFQSNENLGKANLYGNSCQKLNGGRLTTKVHEKNSRSDENVLHLNCDGGNKDIIRCQNSQNFLLKIGDFIVLDYYLRRSWPKQIRKVQRCINCKISLSSVIYRSKWNKSALNKFSA